LLIPALALAFDDVPADHQYSEAISDLSQRGIISGFGDGTFGPAKPVTRQQFAKMIDRTLGLPVDESMSSPFTDLGADILAPGPGVDNLYPHEYVAAAWNHGITTGITPTSFGPFNNISRAQVVTMVVRALEMLHPTLLTSPDAGYANTWGASFSSIHGPNARIAESNGLLAGLPLTGTANDPWAPMPRGEVAQVLHNVLESLDDTGGPPTTPPTTGGPPTTPPTTGGPPTTPPTTGGPPTTPPTTGGPPATPPTTAPQPPPPGG